MKEQRGALPRIREAIVVEGRYDTARLRTVVDALVVETGGFGLFRDREQLALLRRLAGQRGLVILTDSDGAGATFLEENETPARQAFLTKGDLYADGLSGCPDSALRRERLLDYLGLPHKLSTNRLLEVINATLTPEEYRAALAACVPDGQA